MSSIFYAMAGKITKSEVLFEVNRRDCKYPFKVRLNTTDVSVCRLLNKGEYDFIVEYPPEVIVDAGANIGIASIYFANKYPNAKIIAIEPEANNFQLLKQNIAPYPNIIPVQAALWNRNEKINLVDPGVGNWGFETESPTLTQSSQKKVSHDVMGITVDKLLGDYSIDKIDIFKIDIEGAEKEVFSDTSNWIEKVQSLVVELHERLKPGCNRSFYYGTAGFDEEWLQGENLCLSRGKYLKSSFLE